MAEGGGDEGVCCKLWLDLIDLMIGWLIGCVGLLRVW